MNVKEIVKEIDPDYVRCNYCGRLIHKSENKCQPHNKPLCRNFQECSEVGYHGEKNVRNK